MSTFDTDYSFKVWLTTLSYNTTYYYRTYLYQNGSVIYGEIKSFQTKDIDSMPEAVDLGLSVKWRSKNVGAKEPQNTGLFFSFGDVVGQEYKEGSWFGEGFSSDASFELDANNCLKPQYDAARVILGGKWRMPTVEDFEELVDFNNNDLRCAYVESFGYYNISGHIIVARNGNFVFFPCSGRGKDDSLERVGRQGYFWSNKLETCLRMYETCMDIMEFNGYLGFNIRPVCE